MKLTKFILNNGKHFYIEVSDEAFSQFDEASTNHKFLVAQGKRFEHVGVESEKIPIFKEVELLEVKVTRIAGRLVNKNFKMAQSLLDSIEIDEDQKGIDEFIKGIALSRQDPKVQEIIKIQQKGSVYPKDKVRIKIMFFEAKRDALREKMRKHNIEKVPGEDSGFLDSVLEELQSRITNYIKEYQDFPKDD